MALVSPGSQPITLVRRLVSPKQRSMKFECLMVSKPSPDRDDVWAIGDVDTLRQQLQ
jgi:hypothetical protein